MSKRLSDEEYAQESLDFARKRAAEGDPYWQKKVPAYERLVQLSRQNRESPELRRASQQAQHPNLPKQ